MISVFRCRSLLWTPGLKPQLFGRAEDVGADIAILDLEDSVLPDLKHVARDNVINFIAAPHRARFGVRVNSTRTLDGLRDIIAIADSAAAPDLIIIPMVESPSEIIMVDSILVEAGKPTNLCAIVETARGIQFVQSIAGAGGNLRFLHCGPADLTADIGVPMRDWPIIDTMRYQILMAARANGIDAIDATDFALGDHDFLLRNASFAKASGFIGKSAIHPGQIATINSVFSPSTDEVARAEQIIRAAEANKSSSITVVDGKMVGPPILRAAQRVISLTQN